MQVSFTKNYLVKEIKQNQLTSSNTPPPPCFCCSIFFLSCLLLGYLPTTLLAECNTLFFTPIDSNLIGWFVHFALGNFCHQNCFNLYKWFSIWRYGCSKILLLSLYTCIMSCIDLDIGSSICIFTKIISEVLIPWLLMISWIIKFEMSSLKFGGFWGNI